MLNVLNVLNVFDMPTDASLACWAKYFHYMRPCIPTVLTEGLYIRQSIYLSVHLSIVDAFMNEDNRISTKAKERMARAYFCMHPCLRNSGHRLVGQQTNGWGSQVK